MTPNHLPGLGSRGRYTAGCHCEECTAANRAYITRYRRQKGTKAMEDRYPMPDHGTLARRYGNKNRPPCVCDPCRAANAARARRGRAARKARQ